MSDYFDRVEQELGAAVTRRAHVPAVRRLLLRRSRALLACFAVLVVATPPVAAVGGFFQRGAPNPFGPASPNSGEGLAVPHSGRLLSLRIADPDGGPPWGLRLVRTTRGYTCVQLGRIQQGQLGSLGIDHYWADDGRFHPILPDDYLRSYCGVTDARGYGYLAYGITGERSSAGQSYGGHGPASDRCREPGDGVPAQVPLCPVGSSRFVYLGLLGPQARSITYRTPTGGTATQQTVGGVGAYLLVFRRDSATCKLFQRQGALRAPSRCIGDDQFGSTNMGVQGSGTPILAIHYRNGTTCRPVAPAGFDAAYQRYTKAVVAADRTLGQPPRPTTVGVLPPTYRRRLLALERRLAARYLKGYPQPGTAAFMRLVTSTCPWVGYVKRKQPQISAKGVSAPVSARLLPAKRYCSLSHQPNPWYEETPCDGAIPAGARPELLAGRPQVMVQISFTARAAAKNADSWYEESITNPPGCEGSGSGGATFWNIRAGQREVWRDFVPTACKGVYHGTVGYHQNAGPGNPDHGGGGFPDSDGSLIVGHFSFRVP